MWINKTKKTEHFHLIATYRNGVSEILSRADKESPIDKWISVIDYQARLAHVAVNLGQPLILQSGQHGKSQVVSPSLSIIIHLKKIVG